MKNGSMRESTSCISGWPYTDQESCPESGPSPLFLGNWVQPVSGRKQWRFHATYQIGQLAN